MIMILIIVSSLRKASWPLGSLRRLMIAALVLIAACGADTQPDDLGLDDDRIVVVATTSILGDIASNVAGDEARVEVLIPIGVDSHDFQPSSQQASLVAEADLVVANGLGLEQGLEEILTSRLDDGGPVIELAPLVDPIPFSTHEEVGDHEDEAEREPGSDDPHFWMDPIRVGAAAVALATELSDQHPGGSWGERAAAYSMVMDATDETIRDTLASVPVEGRSMVTNHEAFGYFAERYGFEIVGVVIPGGSTLAEPSSAELAELVAEMMEHGTRVIFAETSRPTTLAEAVAAELGSNVEVVELYTESLGPEDSHAETLSSLLESNASAIASALGRE
jgi:zinc/manganese transport system substrate-binding protein